MNSKILLSFIAAAFLSSGYAVAEVRSSKPKVAEKKPIIPTVIQPKWRTFTSPDGHFTVLMPGMPKRKTQIQKTHMGKIKLEIFLIQPPQQEAAYIVTYNEFPDSYVKMTNPQTIMDQAQYVELTTTKSRLLNQRNIRSSNFHPGKEIEYVNAIGKITKTRMFVAHGRLYKVMAIVSKKQHDTLNKTITGYLNSFKLVVKP
ncbi:hypothetical protein [Dolichospermum sp. UHCC 0259]|uniref:hypothetical protein n=1 Tax=Dolichospermum sp. UHCC 0259 TaxID=2590010 RepID=UPI0014464874|nr:hypothetical protein [Dolichospermum sp. UHCC 0259]MTJ50740.1 hypothetical protein [Dolichospermum sp. UHCC 0259]